MNEATKLFLASINHETDVNQALAFINNIKEDKVTAKTFGNNIDVIHDAILQLQDENKELRLILNNLQAKEDSSFSSFADTVVNNIIDADTAFQAFINLDINWFSRLAFSIDKKYELAFRLIQANSAYNTSWINPVWQGIVKHNIAVQKAASYRGTSKLDEFVSLDDINDTNVTPVDEAE